MIDIAKALVDALSKLTALCGDFNAKVGMKTFETETSLGKFDSEVKNDRGETIQGFLLYHYLYNNIVFSLKQIIEAKLGKVQTTT